MIDSRVIPEERWVTVSIGLLEPGNGSALMDLVAQRRRSGTIVDSHILIAMGNTPWVWASLSWLSDAKHQELLALEESASRY